MKSADAKRIMILKEKRDKIDVQIGEILLKYSDEEHLITSNIVDYVIKFYANMYSVGDWEIKSASRKKELKEARLLAIMILRLKYAYTQGKVGEILNRGHSAIVYQEKMGRKRLKEDKDFLEKYNSYKYE